MILVGQDGSVFCSELHYEVHTEFVEKVSLFPGLSGLSEDDNPSKIAKSNSRVVIFIGKKKAYIHRPAPVRNFSLPKKMGATEERFR